ncbi:rhodanese-like domain-containing protein [Desulfovibrio litoralis]|uniref:Rhodanese-related sulfurtransferase n=1 Tax=Desulfovibrio litoralis DSM 11393 TaxID=1121455 RepID=A0A1M7SHD1_9BACT|nr:rhodanese-like domain-containing protein [Desulfovibrio litoralis]SHN57772.1 Rhodanese-related sulfurtransferase [Desulfovibrio litoralis DSM 11393]
MKRIVVLPSGMAGIRTATRLKKQAPSSEINVILPGSFKNYPVKGVFTNYFSKRVTDNLIEKLEGRGLGVVSVDELGLDMSGRELTIKSKRGELPVRFSDLVMELESLPRIPRNLRAATNIFPWPCPYFYFDFEKLDTAVHGKNIENIAVIGGGLDTLEALGLALEATVNTDKKVYWIRTQNSGPSPYNPFSPDIWFYLLNQLNEFKQLTIVDWSDILPEKILFELDGDKITKLIHPSGASGSVQASSFIWAESLYVQHPLIGRAGLKINEQGLVIASPHGEIENENIFLLGSGVDWRRLALPLSSVRGGGKGVSCPIFTEDSSSEVQGRYLCDCIVSSQNSSHLPYWKSAGVKSVEISSNLHVGRIGLGEEEMKAANIEYEYAVALIPVASSYSFQKRVENGELQHKIPRGLMIRLFCLKHSGEILGAQFVSHNVGLESEAVLALLLPMIHSGGTVKTLMNLEVPGRAGGALRSVASMLDNKLQGHFYSISPDEFIASKESGAEFFTIDLRTQHQWQQKNIPEAVNIPLSDLKKRLMTDVPRMMPIVLICEHSNDAYATSCMLHDLGASDLYVLDGGMALWPYDDKPEKK